MKYLLMILAILFASCTTTLTSVDNSPKEKSPLVIDKSNNMTVVLINGLPYYQMYRVDALGNRVFNYSKKVPQINWSSVVKIPNVYNEIDPNLPHFKWCCRHYFGDHKKGTYHYYIE